MLVGLLTRRINLQYMLHKMRRAKTPLCRRCDAEKEISVQILLVMGISSINIDIEETKF